MRFGIGDYVVYPNHGVGVVEEIKQTQVAGVDQDFYHLRILANDPAPWDRLREITGRGADAVFVSVGIPAAYDAAPNYLASGGRVVMVGMPPSGAMSSFEPGNLAAACQSMIGSKMGNTVLQRDIPWLSDLYLQGRLKLDELISRRWSLDEINDAIADTKPGAARRNVIVFR